MTHCEDAPQGGEGPQWECGRCGARFKVKHPPAEPGESLGVASVQCLRCGSSGGVSLPRSIAEVKAYWLEDLGS